MKKVFTTGQIAKICRVAPRTVTKWCDSGRLKHYRIPTSQDRRVLEDDLRAFLAENGMPADGMDDRPDGVLCVGIGEPLVGVIRAAAGDDKPEPDTVIATSLFAAGAEYAARKPAVVVVCLSVGRAEACVIAARIGHGDRRAVILLAGDDVTDVDDLKTHGFSVVLRSPYPPDALTAAVREALGTA